MGESSVHGCDEYYPGAVIAPQRFGSGRYTNIAAGFGRALLATSTATQRQTNGSLGMEAWVSNRLSVTHAWAAAGDYAVVFRALNDSNPAE